MMVMRRRMMMMKKKMMMATTMMIQHYFYWFLRVAESPYNQCTTTPGRGTTIFAAKVMRKAGMFQVALCW